MIMSFIKHTEWMLREGGAYDGLHKVEKGVFTAEIPPWRTEAENNTNGDLQKPIQQILCDVREEWMGQEGSGPFGKMIIRLSAMMGRVALGQDRATIQMIRLARAIVILTLALVLLTAALLMHDFIHPL